MKTLNKVAIEPTYVEYIPELLEPNKLYISEKYKTVAHACLCGCGERVITPITNGQWSLIKERNGSVSLTPSIGNYQFTCKSHYVLTRNIANFI